MKNLRHMMAFLTLFLMAATSVPATTRDDVGTVIALRGKTVIQRGSKDMQARVKDGILLTDTVSTLEASKAKMLFVDDSVLTMGEKSRVVIDQFLYGKEKVGKSIVNLIEGKMRSVVGKAEFEVHTPTAVAAARGTVISFNVALVNGVACTTILPSEGKVVAKSSSRKIKGSLTLTKDMIATICLDRPLPKPVKASRKDMETLLNDTDITGYEISLPAPPGGTGVAAITVGAPPVNQQPITTAGATPPPSLPPPSPPPPPLPSPVVSVPFNFEPPSNYSGPPPYINFYNLR